jgi:hypothetical protein
MIHVTSYVASIPSHLQGLNAIVVRTILQLQVSRFLPAQTV